MSKNNIGTGAELTIGYNDFWFEKVEDATAAFQLLSAAIHVTSGYTDRAAIHVTSGYTDRAVVVEKDNCRIRLVKSLARVKTDILTDVDYEAAKAAAEAAEAAAEAADAAKDS